MPSIPNIHTNNSKFSELLGTGEVDPHFAAAAKRSEARASEEFSVMNNARHLVDEAERITRDAVDPQRTESYMDLEGFNELIDEGHDMTTTRLLLRASGVSIEPVTGDARLHWEDQAPVIVPTEHPPVNQ
jgi:hypothetical protein